MKLDEQYEQHLGATCADVHGTAHHDEWMNVKSSSSGVRFSTSFAEYWAGISDAERKSQHEGNYLERASLAFRMLENEYAKQFKSRGNS